MYVGLRVPSMTRVLKLGMFDMPMPWHAEWQFGWTKEKHSGEVNAVKQCNVYVAFCNFFQICISIQQNYLSQRKNSETQLVQIHKRCHQNSTLDDIINILANVMSKQTLNVGDECLDQALVDDAGQLLGSSTHSFLLSYVTETL